MNAGDFKLYVGGGGINLPFKQALDKAGHQTKPHYQKMHRFESLWGRLVSVVVQKDGDRAGFKEQENVLPGIRGSRRWREKGACGQGGDEWIDGYEWIDT